MNDSKDHKAAAEPPLDCVVRCAFKAGDIVRVQKKTYHGKPADTLAEVLGINDIGWPRIKYSLHNVETLPPGFLVLICDARVRSN